VLLLHAEARHIGSILDSPELVATTILSVASRFKIPRHHVDLICDLNNIGDPNQDLRLCKRVVVLPPEEVLYSQECYCLMRKEDTLREVLVRKGILSSCSAPGTDDAIRLAPPSGAGSVEATDEWWEMFWQCNPWANGSCTAESSVLDRKQEHEIQYVLLPSKVGSTGVSAIRLSGPDWAPGHEGVSGPDRRKGREGLDPWSEGAAAAPVESTAAGGDAGAGGGVPASMIGQSSSMVCYTMAMD
jgi:hypothetical protein